MSLIELKGIEKSFEKDRKLFEDFNYKFAENGFYVLFGESGCGKTTLLNMICGLEKADKGTIIYNGQGAVIDDIAYITQDTYYVDYLTVLDNMKMAASDIKDDEIVALAESVGLKEQLCQYPDVLSGGEKQRLAIVRAIVQRKHIIILDEPTAALDNKNTDMLLKMLYEIKKDTLIIASSHDKSFLDYADHIIDFHCLGKYESKISCESKVITKKENRRVKNKKTLFQTLKYMSKQNKYKKKEKKSAYYLTAFMVVVLLITNFFYDIEQKFNDALMRRYEVNRVLVYCKKDSLDVLEKYEGVVNVSYVQGVNIPYYIEKDGEMVDTAGMFTYGDTLPFDAELFPYVGEIEYGTYFTNANQIILGAECAKKYAGQNMSSLIGKKIELNPLDGNREYEIAGIFGELSYDANQYFLAAGQKTPEYQIYFSDKNLEGLKTHEWSAMECAGIEGKRHPGCIAVYVYFNDEKSFEEFYKGEAISEADKEIFTVGKITSDQADNVSVYNRMKKYVPPIKIAVLAFSVIFFFQTKCMEMNYNSYILAVYDYNGYKKWRVRLSFMLLQIEKAIKCMVCGIVISAILSYLLNMLDGVIKICPFTPFAIDTNETFRLLAVMIGASAVMSLITGLILQMKGWFSLLKRNRDLL